MNNNPLDRVEHFGDVLVEAFHLIGLFVIGAAILWASWAEVFHIIREGGPSIKDVLLLFIYLELGAMVGIYFKTHRLPVQFLIYIAITALSRHLVIDVQKVSDSFHLYLLLSITGSIVVLSLAILILTYTVRKFGRPEDDVRTSSSSDI